tara:strand:- start:67 stop:480 length:414 start_codon:yes stop_codon:yes gene_type:complete
MICSNRLVCILVNILNKYSIYIEHITEHMLKKLILIVTLALVQANCPQREEMMRCFYEKADKNGDGIVTKHELSKKVFSTLSWYEKIPFNIFGGIARIMKDCDANSDGKLTVEESLSMKYCMDSCFKRRHTKEKFNC